MAFTPDSPFPKTRGHVIKSKDWNEAITEIQRLDTAKVNRSGDGITGSLTIGGNAGVGTTSPQAKLHVAGGSVRWGNNSELVMDQGGSLELGGNNSTAGTGTPYIDFHFSGRTQDFNTRIINDADGVLSVYANTFRVSNTLRWGNSIANPDSIELGAPDSSTPGIGTPFIDFHFQGVTQDFNTRIINDANGRLSLVAPTLQASGNVGIGTPTPSDRLDVAGNLRILTGSNPIRFTSGWSGFPDPVNNQAEISNDTGTYKTLMIIGNKSGGLGRRVSVWDRLEVNGTFQVSGEVRLGASDAPVYIGGNQTGIFMALHDDLWFSDPQTGSIEIKNGNNTGWGRMVGIFAPPSSIEYKKDVRVLNEPELTHLLHDALSTDIVRYRYKGDGEESRLRLGVIVENCPQYLVGEDDKSLSTTEYIAMLHGAVKALVNKVSTLENHLSG